MDCKEKGRAMAEEHERSIAKMLAYAKGTENRGALCRWISICIGLFLLLSKLWHPQDMLPSTEVVPFEGSLERHSGG